MKYTFKFFGGYGVQEVTAIGRNKAISLAQLLFRKSASVSVQRVDGTWAELGTCGKSIAESFYNVYPM